jgi:hypothetical protein
LGGAAAFAGVDKDHLFWTGVNGKYSTLLFMQEGLSVIWFGSQIDWQIDWQLLADRRSGGS